MAEWSWRSFPELDRRDWVGTEGLNGSARRVWAGGPAVGALVQFRVLVDEGPFGGTGQGRPCGTAELMEIIELGFSPCFH